MEPTGDVSVEELKAENTKLQNEMASMKRKVSVSGPNQLKHCDNLPTGATKHTSSSMENRQLVRWVGALSQRHR